MEYRIRCRERTGGRHSEFTIEANSPTEAMVKVRHSMPWRGGAHRPELDEILSICPDSPGWIDEDF